MKNLSSRCFIHPITIGLMVIGCFLLVGCSKQTSSSTSPTTTIKEAEILYDMGKNQEALDFYNQKLDGNSTDFSSYITRGKILVKLGRYDDAINDFYKASKLDDSQATYMLYKGLVTMQSAVDVNALDALNLSGTTNLDMFTFYRCALIYQLNKFADAGVCLDKLLAIDNNNPQGNFLKAMTLSKTGKRKDSIKYFDKAEQGGLATQALRSNKGIALANLENTGAITYLDKALAIDANDTGALYAKTLVSFVSEMYKDGLASIDKAITVDATNKTYYILKGDLLTRLGNYGQAIKAYDKALVIDSKDSTTLAKKSLVQYQAEDLTSADTTIKEAKLIVPINANKYLDLAIVLTRMKKYDDAMIYTDKTLTLASYSTYAKFNKALTYYMLGKLPEANTRYQNLRGAKTVAHEAKIVFVNYQRILGNYKDASTLIDEVLKDDPTNEMALASKVKLYIDMAKAGKAVTDKKFDFTTPTVVDAALSKLNKYWFLKNYR